VTSSGALRMVEPKDLQNPCSITTACSDLDHHKVHAHHYHAKLRISDCALQVGRPVADAGR
jgi:hypothetical protein